MKECNVIQCLTLVGCFVVDLWEFIQKYYKPPPAERDGKRRESSILCGEDEGYFLVMKKVIGHMSKQIPPSSFHQYASSQNLTMGGCHCGREEPLENSQIRKRRYLRQKAVQGLFPQLLNKQIFNSISLNREPNLSFLAASGYVLLLLQFYLTAWFWTFIYLKSETLYQIGMEILQNQIKSSDSHLLITQFIFTSQFILHLSPSRHSSLMPGTYSNLGPYRFFL